MGSGAAIQASGASAVQAGGELIEQANQPLPFDADAFRIDHQADPAPRLD
ncbi:MAG: hypothetical protein HC871_15200 [Rhizobiales bacterium]|nr:hypothetical protein [Hyphomicrobiales bacterium]